MKLSIRLAAGVGTPRITGVARLCSGFTCVAHRRISGANGRGEALFSPVKEWCISEARSGRVIARARTLTTAWHLAALRLAVAENIKLLGEQSTVNAEFAA